MTAYCNLAVTSRLQNRGFGCRGGRARRIRMAARRDGFAPPPPRHRTCASRCRRRPRPPRTRAEYRPGLGSSVRGAAFAARRGGYPRRGRCARRGRRHQETRLGARACPQDECKTFGAGLRSFSTLPAPRPLGAGLPRGPPPDAAGCGAGRTVAASMAEGGTVQDAPSTPRFSSGTPCAAIGFRRKASCRASLDARRGTRRADWTGVRPPGLRAQPGARIARCCERADGRAPGRRSRPATDKPFDRFRTARIRTNSRNPRNRPGTWTP